jgi:hypothetical protein
MRNLLRPDTPTQGPGRGLMGIVDSSGDTPGPGGSDELLRYAGRGPQFYPHRDARPGSRGGIEPDICNNGFGSRVVLLHGAGTP